MKREPQGIPTGGQFATDARTEADVNLVREEYTAAEKAVTESLAYVDLAHVEQGDGLTNDQANRILRGEWNDVEDEIIDAHYDDMCDRADELAREAVEESGADWDDFDEDEQDRLREIVMEADTSDPLAAHLRHTRALVRVPVAGSLNLAYLVGNHWMDNSEEDRGPREQAIATLLADAGVDTDDPGVKDAIEELVAEGPYAWTDSTRLDVLWHGGIEDVAVKPRGAQDGTRTLSFTNPSVVLIDTTAGSGHEVTVPATVTSKLGGEVTPRLDEEEHGYGWDQTAGVVKSAYATKMNSQWEEA